MHRENEENPLRVAVAPVSKIVEADALAVGPLEEAAEAAGEVGRVERSSSRRGEDEDAVLPG